MTKQQLPNVFLQLSITQHGTAYTTVRMGDGTLEMDQQCSLSSFIVVVVLKCKHARGIQQIPDSRINATCKPHVLFDCMFDELAQCHAAGVANVSQ